MIKVVVGEKEYEFDFSRTVIDALKTIGARFDGEKKVWRVEPPLKTAPPRELARAIPELAEMPIGDYAGNYYHYVGPEPKFLTYTVRRFKTVDCDEYCEDRCEDWCVDSYDEEECRERCRRRCVKKCEDGGWTPRIEVEEEVKLYWPGKRAGEWAVPRGLVKIVEERLGFRAPDYALEVAEIAAPNEGLRDYQTQVAASILTALKRYGGGIAQMATGAGKSYMAGALAKALQDKYAVLVTTLRVDLVRQMQEFARQFGTQPVGYTVQTLYSRLFGGKNGEAESTGDEELDAILKAYGKAEDVPKDEVEKAIEEALKGKKGLAIVVDETHHVPARTVKEVVRGFEGFVAERLGRGAKTLRIGLSATPWRNDGRDMEIYAWIGPVVEPRISSSYLIERGFAVPVEIHMIKMKDICGANDGESFAEVRRALAECDERNKFIAKLVEKAPKPALVLTPLVKHAEELFHMAKVRSRLVTGAVDADKRADAYNAIKSGMIDAIFATTVADEGLDLPPIRSLILALGGKSKTLTLQRVGRAVRPYPDKDLAVVYDICDNVKYFKAHCEERRKLYETEPKWHIIEEIL